jgi:hypothetical protein
MKSRRWMALIAIGLCSVAAAAGLTLLHGFGFGSLPPALAGSLLVWAGIRRAVRPAANAKADASTMVFRWMSKVPKEIALLAGMAVLSTGLALSVSRGISVSVLPLLGSGTALTITSYRRFSHSAARCANSESTVR